MGISMVSRRLRYCWYRAMSARMDAPPAAESLRKRSTRPARDGKSTPAENTGPSPRRRMTRMSALVIRSSTISAMTASMSNVIALRFSGRFSVR